MAPSFIRAALRKKEPHSSHDLNERGQLTTIGQ